MEKIFMHWFLKMNWFEIKYIFKFLYYFYLIVRSRGNYLPILRLDDRVSILRNKCFWYSLSLFVNAWFWKQYGLWFFFFRWWKSFSFNSLSRQLNILVINISVLFIIFVWKIYFYVSIFTIFVEMEGGTIYERFMKIIGKESRVSKHDFFFF